MQIVVEIPNKIYKSVQDGTYCGTLYKELKNGTPLPKAKTGKWLVYTDCEGKMRQCKCDQCGHKTSIYTWKNPNFCENCGAKMESEDKEC